MTVNCLSTDYKLKSTVVPGTYTLWEPQAFVQRKMGDFLQDFPELQPFVLSNVLLTGGAGAYGTVEEVAIPGANCAAKKLHDIFQDTARVPASSIRKASEQFVCECQLMVTLRHPNIVQFLGVCLLPGSRLPALVMERLLTSLHDLLDPTDPPPPPNAPKPFFPLSLKCSVLHNVACGLAYLHQRSPPVIHRDLSARNILLNSGMVAKIADLGVARIVACVGAIATMTKAPGAGVYMPPEALEDKEEDENSDLRGHETKAKYNASIDIFSFGVVAIFTLSQAFPQRLLAPTYPKDGKLVARTELERRERYMRVISEQLRSAHPLVQMIRACLDLPECRPMIQQVLQFLELARAEVWDEHVSMSRLQLLQAVHLGPKFQGRDVLQEKEKQIHHLQQQLMAKESKLKDREARIIELEHQLQLKDSTKNVLSEKEKSTTVSLSKQQLSVKCYSKKRSPFKATRGSITHDSAFAYVTPAGSADVYRCNLNTELWETLPSLAYRECALVVFDGALTAVGGVQGSHFSKKLLTLRENQWVEEYPPMTTARSFPAVVCSSSGDYLVVIGGYVRGLLERVGLSGGIGNATAAVEVLDVEKKIWHRVFDLPLPLPFPSATVCSDRLFVVGSNRKGCACSLQALISTANSTESPSSIHWQSLPRIPVSWSTVATLFGHIVLVGGVHGVPSAPVSTIHQLFEGEWVKIGSLVHGRSECLVTSPSLNRIFVVGGQTVAHSIEECVVQ